MPPDDYLEGGRDRHVRDVTAHNFSLTSTVFVNFPSTTSIPPITPSSSPIGSTTSHSIENQNKFDSNLIGAFNSKSLFSARPHSSPLLTPCSSSDSLSLSCAQNTRHILPLVLTTIFPEGLTEVDTVHDISTQLPNALKGAIVDRPSGLRSVYILGLSSSDAPNQRVRDIVVRVLDLADEEFEADQAIFALNKQDVQFRELLQGLLYVGGTVIKNEEHSAVNKDVVLVGIEI